MAVARQFRDTFQVPQNLIKWFPGHMRNSLIKMQAKMRKVDLVIEVHDSRIPFSGRNPIFVRSLIGNKPHILVLTKMDLINSSMCGTILSKYKELDMNHLIFANCLNQTCKGLKQLMSLTKALVESSSKIQTSIDVKYTAMVVGIPNVGKSSLINVLRNITVNKGKAAPVGAIPGVTRSVQSDIKICKDPPIYLIDTPGIFLPKISDNECGMKLALCSCIKDETVGVQVIADFLLYWMNKNRNFKYVEYFNLEEPTDKILPLLIKIALSKNKKIKIKNIAQNVIENIPDVQFAANHLVTLYRKGEFGDLYLDKSYF